MRNDLTVGTLSFEELSLRESEMAARLQTPHGLQPEQTQEVLSEIARACTIRYAGTTVAVTPTKTGCLLGDIPVESRSLCDRLACCKEACLFAVTLGVGIDRLIAKNQLLSLAKGFLTDGLASCVAEAAADRVDELLRGGKTKPIRFSPGYGDLPLSLQIPLLERLSANQTCGIVLNGALLMTPSKSITAIGGILR